MAALVATLAACASVERPVAGVPPAPLQPKPPATLEDKLRRLVDAAEAEWRRWGRQVVRSDDDGRLCAVFEDGRCEPVEDGCGREQSRHYCGLVDDYWRPIRELTGRLYAHDCSQLDLCTAIRPPQAEIVRTPAWSAAFIGALMQDAGFTAEEFRVSPFHAEYVVAARDGFSRAYQVVPTPARAAPGDLVCTIRSSAAPSAGPEAIGQLRADIEIGHVTPMHCDVVVGIERDGNEALTIGGNVLQSVSLRHVALDPAGRIPAPGCGQRGWLLVLRARLDDAATPAPAEASPTDAERPPGCSVEFGEERQ